MRGKKISFKFIMLISYTVILVLTLSIYSFRSFSISEKAVTNIAHENMQKLIEAKNEILDMSFAGIREASLNLLVDEELYKIFSEMDWENSVSLGETDDDIKGILQKYFYSYQQIASVFLITDVYTFGYGDKDVIYGESFFESDLYEKVEKLEGRTFFAPMRNGYFSMLRLGNFMVSEEEGRIRGLADSSQMPVLVIGFKETVFREEMQNLLPQEEAEYMVLSEDGTIISHSDRSQIGSHYENKKGKSWKEEMLQQKKDMIICQDVSEVTGWTTAVTMSKNMLMKDILSEVSRDLLFVLLLAAVIGGMVALLITHKINGSIHQMVKIVERMGKGDFEGKVKNTGVSEFDYLVKSFNDMGAKLKSLIEENFLIKIRQQESEIAILNTQLNPHFLQNTLNVIQMSNLTGNKNETGKMIVALSRMLHYTMDNREEMKVLREDMDWLNQYIFIMKCRYGNEFRIDCAIEEEIMDQMVPKLFLQPILENSILHAFKEKETGGIITVTGKQGKGQMIFTVEDNGDGMEEEKIWHFFEDSSDSIGIKNVYARLCLIYKRDDLFEVESRPGYGTKTTIYIPL